MKSLKAIALPLGISLLAGLAFTVAAQQGPTSSQSETVAKPRKKAGDAPAEPEKEKIPSKFEKRKELPQDIPTFRSDVVTVTVDVAVLDNKGHFIPKIPRGNFRVMEDNVPQQVSEFNVGEAPMTVCMVIEFSNLYQQYWSVHLVPDAAGGLRLPGDSEAGGLRSGGGLRSTVRDPVRLLSR